MRSKITRRDFLNGALLGAGALLLDFPAPLRLFAQDRKAEEFSGIGDYAVSAGDTAEVIRIYQSIDSSADFTRTHDIIDTGEMYDAVIVGGGLSGLGAAYEFFRVAPKKARCIILDNHLIFGGAAKRNEFIVQGERLIGPQGSNAFGVIDRPDIPGYEIYNELGIPTEFEYADLGPDLNKLDFDPTNFGYRLWFTSKNIGYYFNGRDKDARGQWAAGFWEKGLEQSPYSDKVRKDFLRWRDTTERHYEGGDYDRWLDSMTYQDYLEHVLKLDPAVTRLAHPVLASVLGLGCDAISAYAASQVHMPGFPGFEGNRSLRYSHWHSFPGGNDGFSRSFIKALIPQAIDGGRNFAEVQNGKVRFSGLDVAANRVRLRLGAAVVRVEHDNEVPGKSISVTYVKDGRLYRLKGRSAVMASGSRISRRVVFNLPKGHTEAYAHFHVSPILVANVALTNWRFLYRMGLTACLWSDGFGFGCNIRKPMYIGSYRPPLHPDKPTVLTFYVPFHEPGLPIEEQGEKGRKKLLGTSYREFEVQIVDQMRRLFSDAGFSPDKDIAGIILNRWTYAYVNPQPGFYFGREGRQAPRDVIRNSFGRITFAHAELNGHQHWLAAVAEGQRAARQAIDAL